jgi:trehalose-phosphatase
VRIGILSGRALSDLRVKVPVPNAIHAGCHGLEVTGPGLAFRHPGAEMRRPMLQAIAGELGLRVGAIAGARVEFKGLAVAVHYRGVPHGQGARLAGALGQVVRPHRAQIELLRGKKVVEILPKVRWNKGACALWIRDRVRDEIPAPLTMLYAGDDRTEERAFRLLSGDAVTARVGAPRGRTAAIYRLRSMVDVHGLLSVLADEIGRTSTQPFTSGKSSIKMVVFAVPVNGYP